MSDLTVYQGELWQRTLTVTREDTGARKNLTGATIELVAARNFGDAAAFTLTVGDGITLLAQSGDTLGQATIEISEAISNTLELENYVFRVSVQPSGEPTPQIVIPWRKLPVQP